VANFKLVLQDLMTHVLPRRTLQLQCRYMHRTVRKSPEMSTREFITRLMEVNQLLNEFPPFVANQALPEDEIFDIAEFAIPASWQKTMVLQGFDPTMHTPNKFIEFCERLKFAEGFNAQQHNNKKEMSSQADLSGHSMETLTWSANKSSRRGKNRNKKRKERDLYCELHGTTDHDTGECKVLKAQARKMRANWETHRSNYGPRKTRNDRDHNNNKRGKNNEEVNAIDDDDFFEKKVRKVLAELLPRTPRNMKKTRNENFNVDEFNKLKLSDDDTTAMSTSGKEHEEEE